MIWAMWRGGPNYAPGEIDTHLEEWPDADTLVNQYERRRDTDGQTQLETRYVGLDNRLVFFPVVDNPEMEVFLSDPRDWFDYPEPDAWLVTRDGHTHLIPNHSFGDTVVRQVLGVFKHIEDLIIGEEVHE